MTPYTLVRDNHRSPVLTPPGPRITVRELRRKLLRCNPDAVVYLCTDGSNGMALTESRVLEGDHAVFLGWIRDINDTKECA